MPYARYDNGHSFIGGARTRDLGFETPALTTELTLLLGRIGPQYPLPVV